MSAPLPSNPHMKRAMMSGYSLYRQFITAANRAPISVRKKILYNVRDAFIIAKNSGYSPQQRMEMIERGYKDLVLLQRIVLLPKDLQQPLYLKTLAGMRPEAKNSNNHKNNAQ